MAHILTLTTAVLLIRRRAELINTLIAEEAERVRSHDALREFARAAALGDFDDRFL